VRLFKNLYRFSAHGCVSSCRGGEAFDIPNAVWLRRKSKNLEDTT